MKKSLIISIICLLLQSCMSINASAETTAPHDNAIQLGNAKLAVCVLVLGNRDDLTFDVDSFLDEINVFCSTRSLFDSERDANLIPLTMSRGEYCVYHQEIPLECKEEVVGLRVCKGSEFQGGTECILHQDSINKFILYLSKDGRILNCDYPQGDIKEWMDIAAVGYNSEMVDPSVFVPRKKSLYDKSWQEVTDNMVNSLWPEFLKQSIETITLPSFAEDWVVNTLKKRFASSCILPYVRNADMLLGKSVTEPPMEAYYFLDSINYSPDIFLKNEMNFPQAWFLGSILKYPDGGLNDIGETPVAQWQEYAYKKLAPAMKERPKLLLDLLSGMSYANQLDNGTPLTETQIKNIKEGYTDDIGKIILNRNEKLLSTKGD